VGSVFPIWTFFLVVLGFELVASHLLSRPSVMSAMIPALQSEFIRGTGNLFVCVCVCVCV
jgi:hypothetical protein